jgi:2-polyprenyl-6-methoxyphenol hydroxylase-like FAD-dependent oxidoreductase
MMLSYLLARSGVAVTLIEKHGDFLRDFRGDTVHPSTLDVLDELGLLDEFLAMPHQQLTSVRGVLGGFPFEAANFSHVSARCKFVALMPQWDFLNFLASRAKNLPGFDLRMQYEAVDLIYEGERVTGVDARTAQGNARIMADLVVGCDGRHSITRKAARLELIESGVPIDVLWFRLSRKPDDPDQLLGNINYGKALVLINRDRYFQAGLIIRKDSFDQVRSNGLAAFQAGLRQIAPYLGDRVEEVRDWNQVKLLSVQINRLKRWYAPGLLCIGDAAHAMSPAGGVGINLAIQDAVAAANLLAGPLLGRRVDEAVLARVQKRRELPARVTQFFQVGAHKALSYVFRHPGALEPPWQFRLAVSVPGIQHVTGRLVGMGMRPEHVCEAGKPYGEAGLLQRAAVLAGKLAGIAVRTLRTVTDGARRAA